MQKVKAKKKKKEGKKKSIDYIAEKKRECAIFSLGGNQETIYYAGG